jgi:hypothetical protein
MATTPPTAGPLEPLARVRSSYAGLSRTRRELIVLGAALLFGLVVMPFLVWYAGMRVLGPYTHGNNPHAGPFALLWDYFVGLFHGSAVFWTVALGPLALLLLVRGFLALLRVLPSARTR